MGIQFGAVGYHGSVFTAIDNGYRINSDQYVDQFEADIGFSQAHGKVVSQVRLAVKPSVG